MNLISILVQTFFLTIIDCYFEENIEKGIQSSDILLQNYIREEGIPGLVVGISVNRSQQWVKGYGFSDIENGVKCEKNTVMRIASITKTLGTVLVTKLVEKKKLEWDQDIGRYIGEKDFPKKLWKGKAVKISLRQLVSHMSGLRSTEDRDFAKVLRFENATQTLVMFSAEPLRAEPETEYFYSNFGWQLIGAIVECVTGQRYETLINQLFADLGMKSSRMERRLEIVANRSQYYFGERVGRELRLRKTRIVDSIRPFPNWPCGGALSTVPDLLTYAEALMKSYENGGILRKENVNELWNYRKPGIGFENRLVSIAGHQFESYFSYAMGWQRIQFSDSIENGFLSNITFVHHFGSLYGNTAILGIFPQKNISISILTNLGGLEDTLDLVVLQILENFLIS